jgi:hypothetical protein
MMNGLVSRLILQRIERSSAHAHLHKLCLRPLQQRTPVGDCARLGWSLNLPYWMLDASTLKEMLRKTF